MILKVITQDKKNEYGVISFKVVPENNVYKIVGLEACTKQSVVLGVYTNGIFAINVFGAMKNQLRTQFKGGPYYNIYEMPYDEVDYTSIN